MPDYMLVFAVPILAHLPEFTAYNDQEALTIVREALYFVMEPLISKNENFSFNFYKVSTIEFVRVVTIQFFTGSESRFRIAKRLKNPTLDHDPSPES